MKSLPIDEVLPSLLESLSQPATSRVILEAPPGAGKTTRVPPALLDQPWCQGTVLVSEPRRIAARLSAARVSDERNTRLGGECGYQVRFDDKSGKDTRLLYMTEGLLLRRLLDSPDLPGVSAVVLDEVHERSSDLDTLLALLQETQGRRSDLKLIVMSATLDADDLVAYLAPAICHRSEGRSFDVAIEYQSKPDERPLEIQVRSAIKTCLHEEGDVLVFLPGGREIRRCQEALGALEDVEAVPLHGDLSIEEQTKAIAPSRTRKKRVVLSTNVAESSLTIVGVTTVIDSGLARTGVFDSFAGVGRLETVAISKARAVQRAGRAGRVRAGRAVRLYTRGQFQARPDQDKPELLRTDLSALYLQLAFARESQKAEFDPRQMHWLTPPDESAWHRALGLLVDLGAWDEGGITKVGRAMVSLPLPPRLARIAVEGWRRHLCTESVTIAAILSERDITQRPKFNSARSQDVVSGDSDLDERLDKLEQLRDEKFHGRRASDLGLDARQAKLVDKTARMLVRDVERACKKSQLSHAESEPTVGDELTTCLLRGFPDRVAQRRGKARDLVLSSGLQASLHELSCVTESPLLLAVGADAPFGANRKPVVRLACRLEADWLLDGAGESVDASEQFMWNDEKERVDCVSRLSYGKVTLDESRTGAAPSPEAAQVLSRALISKGAAVYDPNSELESLFVRLSLLMAQLPELSTELCPEHLEILRSTISDREKLAEEALKSAALYRSRLDQFKGLNLAEELEESLPKPLLQLLKRECPMSCKLKGGRNLPIHYDIGRTPWIESRLQDFFSMEETPRICRARLPLQLHLLAPNKRAVQVTTDLDGFWKRHYPDLRKQLMRRYPKHLWPEEGRTAKPPTPGRIR